MVFTARKRNDRGMKGIRRIPLLVWLILIAVASVKLLCGKSLLRTDRDVAAVWTTKHDTVLPHDHPRHPWHWSRENLPDPRLSKKRDCDGSLYKNLYAKFHQEGYVVFRSCSLQAMKSVVRGSNGPPTTLLDDVAAFTETIQGIRVQNTKEKCVKELSVDPDTLEFIEYLHGGTRAFPFQTLNFPKGTQQPLHSDLIHFDTMPRTLMTAAWVALEDMSEDNGPLMYYPKSHLHGTWDYDELGLHQKHDNLWPHKLEGEVQSLYGDELVKAMERVGLKRKMASDIKRGQTFVWAAGLTHGGSPQKNTTLSRLSQVTHYYFEGAEYYWVPRLSYRAEGEVYYRSTDAKPCVPQFMPAGGSATAHSCADTHIKRWTDEL